MQSVISLIQFAGQSGFDAMLAMLGHDSLITRSRNTLVTQFLSTPATHMLFIDADISFDPQQVYDMLAFDEDFVAGMYPLKVIDWGAPAMKRLTTGETFKARRCFMSARPAPATKPNGGAVSSPAFIPAAAS